METFLTIEEINEAKKLLEFYKNSYKFENGKYVFNDNVPFILKKYFIHQNNTKSFINELSNRQVKESPTDEEYEEMLKILEDNMGELSDDEWILN